MSSEEGLKERVQWERRLDFMFSLIGFSVGLGNIWRFPYMCYKNGGGAFLIPYFIFLGVGGIPLLMLELGIGQFTSQGGITSWNLIPGFKGIGIASVIIMGWLNCYYNVILAWDIYYIGLSFSRILPWSHCNNEFNTPDCLNPEWTYGDSDETAPEACGFDSFSSDDNDVTWKQVCLNGTLRNLSDFTPAVEEFWERKLLKQHLSSGIDDMGGMNWELMLCLLLAWVIVYFIICKGVKSSGKVVYFTAMFPYIILIVLLIRAVTLENALEGIKFYLNPVSSRLKDGQVWIDAATQIFYSYSIGNGTMIALSSYNKRKHNFIRDGFIFTCINSGTSFIAGFAIFSVLGFMAGKQGVEVGDVAKGGPGLAFIAFPEAVAQMPLPQLWAVLFFLMVFFLGIDSQFCQCEGFITAIVDTWPRVFRKGYKREVFVAVYCLISCCVGISMTTYGGIYLLQLFDYYSASGSTLMWITFFETFAIAYCYGGKRFIRDLRKMLGKTNTDHTLWRVTEWYFTACWYFLTPLATVAICIFSFVTYEHMTYQGYIYPWWGYAIGWFLALSSMMAIPTYFIIAFSSASGNLHDRWEEITTPTILTDYEMQDNLEGDKEDTTV